MAKVKVEMPEEFLRKLSLLGSKTDEIAGRVLEAGGEVVLSKVRSNLSSVIGSGTKYDSRSTGELERSLGLTPPLVDRDGTVLFDNESDASGMENHSQREEIREAFETGEGSATRRSSTLSEPTVYSLRRGTPEDRHRAGHAERCAHRDPR